MKHFYVVVGSAMLILLILLCSLGFGLWPVSGLGSSDRIGLMQVVIEIVGFGLAVYSGWFAALQFSQSQLKPIIQVTFENQRDNIQLQRFAVAREAPLPIHIHNHGVGVGRHILLNLVFPQQVEINLGEEDQHRGWVLQYDQNLDVYSARFSGPADFVAYQGFPLYAGKLRMRIDAGTHIERYQVHWQALAENMDSIKGELYINVQAIEM